LDEGKRWDEPSPFYVLLVAQTKNPVVTIGRIKVLPDYNSPGFTGLDAEAISSHSD